MGAGPRYWAVVPAAGIGQRMAAATPAGLPKQYLPLLEHTVIEWALQPLLAADWIEAVVVALAADDPHFSQLPSAEHHKLRSTTGGSSRAESVLAALRSLPADAAQDWVLVHDAARPCLHAQDLQALRDQASSDDGGLLATPVADTLKRAAGRQVITTVPRDDLWRALTPQMFRVAQLQAALAEALRSGAEITDDASAIELAGGRPLLVAAEYENPKLTWPQDLAQIRRLLQRRQQQD